jgi:Flp pilus assembly protein TadG
MKKLKEILLKRRNNEDGAAELYSAMIVIPILLILLVSIIDVGSYYLSVGRVADVTKEASRQVAIYGGSDSAMSRSKLAGSTVQQKLLGMLWDGKNCTQSRCTKAPVVTCSNTLSGAFGVLQPGDYVNCKVEYYYDSILGNQIGTAAGPLDFGLTTFLEQKKVITQVSVSETWGF